MPLPSCRPWTPPSLVLSLARELLWAVPSTPHAWWPSEAATHPAWSLLKDNVCPPVSLLCLYSSSSGFSSCVLSDALSVTSATSSCSGFSCVMLLHLSTLITPKPQNWWWLYLLLKYVYADLRELPSFVGFEDPSPSSFASTHMYTGCALP